MNSEDQFNYRKDVVSLHKDGKSNQEISTMVGYCNTRVSTILKNDKKDILDMISTKPIVRGRKHGEQRRLTFEQETVVKELLITTSPAQLKYPTGLWSRKNIQLLIKDKFKIIIPLRTITDYLGRWGVKLEKPFTKSKKYEMWLKTEYQEIEANSKRKRAAIHWFKYSDVDSEASDSICYSVIQLSPDDCEANMSDVKILSTVTNRGEKYFMLVRNKITASNFRTFLRNLVYKRDDKIFLIMRHRRLLDSDALDRFCNMNTTGKKIDFYLLP